MLDANAAARIAAEVLLTSGACEGGHEAEGIVVEDHSDYFHDIVRETIRALNREGIQTVDRESVPCPWPRSEEYPEKYVVVPYSRELRRA